MLGGHWDFGPNLTTVGNGSQSMLLSSKALWRQGFLRCPEYCSQDTPSTDCTCSCPESLREEAFGESVSTTARERRRVEPRARSSRSRRRHPSIPCLLPERDATNHPAYDPHRSHDMAPPRRGPLPRSS